MADATNRGSIAFFTTYRPPVELDLYSSPVPPQSKTDELHLTDSVSYNHNARVVPPAALQALIQRPRLASLGITDADISSGRVTGLAFVSERARGLETLHLALRFHDDPPTVFICGFAELYDAFKGVSVRMEDCGVFVGGDYIVYISTMQAAESRRQPWTVAYMTHLVTGETVRLTPQGTADLNPAVSPSGKKIAIASFEQKGGWSGEIENLKTSIYVIDIENPSNRRPVIVDGGWPTWGRDDVLFFHRKLGNYWGVFRAELGDNHLQTSRVTPENIDAMTPAAINATTVAVATIREKSTLGKLKRQVNQYRHIEIFDSTGGQPPIQITQVTKPLADHYDPFVILPYNRPNDGLRIGYHRCMSKIAAPVHGDISNQLEEIESPLPEVDVFRVKGVFPTFSDDATKLAFVNNLFTTVYVVDEQGSRIVFEAEKENSVFGPVWNKAKDILYICVGPSFDAPATVDIYAILGACSSKPIKQKLTNGFNNAFPSSNPEGTKLVFRSTRDGGDQEYKNLYIMEDAKTGEGPHLGGPVTRLTNGPWVDTHCDWSPNGKWIVFASIRDKPKDAPPLDNGLDAGYFAVYLVNPDDPSVVVRVVQSGPLGVGHVNHPFFSPDGLSIVVVSDLAAVSIDPISMPLFLHSVRPYGDIFVINIDPDDINKNKDLEQFTRITHSRYENSTAVWSKFSGQAFIEVWNRFIGFLSAVGPIRSCPFAQEDGGESWYMTGHLCIAKRSC